MFKVTVLLPLLVSLQALPLCAGTADSEQVLKILADARTEALVLRQDAGELKTFRNRRSPGKVTPTNWRRSRRT